MSEQTALHQARALRLEGIRTGHVLTGPQTVHIDMANGCNTVCTTCWDHSPLLRTPRSAAWKRQLFPIDTFTALADDLVSMGSVEAVILSGMGDPFVHPHLYEAIAIAKHKGWHVTVLTNALLADPQRVLALDLDMMLISVNGVSPESYVAFHPNLSPHHFARLTALLATFAAAGKHYKHVQVINRDTAPELVEMMRFAARYKAAQVTLKLASLGGGTEACQITPWQRTQLLDTWIPQARTEAARLGVHANLDVFEAQVRTGGLATAPSAEVGCFMGWTYARVTVDGTILYCCSTEIAVGHLADGPFSTQWFAPTWQQVRERLMAGQYYPSCSQCGKLNQNAKIARHVQQTCGEAVYLARTGRTDQGARREPAQHGTGSRLIALRTAFQRLTRRPQEVKP